MTREEAERSYELEDMFIIKPEELIIDRDKASNRQISRRPQVYVSEEAPLLSKAEIKELLREIDESNGNKL